MLGYVDKMDRSDRSGHDDRRRLDVRRHRRFGTRRDAIALLLLSSALSFATGRNAFAPLAPRAATRIRRRCTALATGTPLAFATDALRATDSDAAGMRQRAPQPSEDMYETFDREIARTVSRRDLVRSAAWCVVAGTTVTGSMSAESAAAYRVDRVEPDEAETYALAQIHSGHGLVGGGKGPLRVLWVGAGDLKGVFKGLFRFSNEVVALDLVEPDAGDLDAAATYATEHGFRLRFVRGDATKLEFPDESFDVVVSSLFLCQDFDPAVVVSEIRRVLRPGGRFGFYEDEKDIDEVIVRKVFGDRSVVRVQNYPEKINIIAGVVRKV